MYLLVSARTVQAVRFTDRYYRCSVLAVSVPFSPASLAKFHPLQAEPSHPRMTLGDGGNQLVTYPFNIFPEPGRDLHFIILNADICN